MQAFGALIAFDQHEDGRLQVMQCSEVSSAISIWLLTELTPRFPLQNSGKVLDIEPHELLSADSLASFLPEASTLKMADALELFDRPRSPGRERLPQSFRMAWEGTDGAQREGDCVIHRPSPVRQPRRVVLEVELVDDVLHPLAPPSSPPHLPSAERRKAGLPTPTERIVEQDELNKATESILNPLTELNRWRRRKRMGVKAEMDYMSLVTDITEQLSLAAERETRDVFWNVSLRAAALRRVYADRPTRRWWRDCTRTFASLPASWSTR